MMSLTLRKVYDAEPQQPFPKRPRKLYSQSDVFCVWAIPEREWTDDTKAFVKRMINQDDFGTFFAAWLDRIYVH